MTQQEKVVVITGAAGGIGRALCEGFVADGYRVAAVDRDGVALHALMMQLGAGHQGFTCDLSSEAQIVESVGRIASHFGRIDVLVNNAAVGPTMESTAQTSVEGFEQALAVNAVGPMLMAREVSRYMGDTGGAIVNVASLAGLIANPRRNAYAASKAAVLSMTRSLACEWAHRRIRVVAVAPGYVMTPMVADLERDGKVDLSRARQRIPMGRLARPDEIAAAVRFLASARAGYITGTELIVDGGWACFNQPGDAHPSVPLPPVAESQRDVSQSGPRVVVVTGGGRGIGAEIARSFRGHGDHVIVLDQEAGDMHLDLRSEHAVCEAFAGIAERFGRIDVLINNAAVADTFMPAEEQGSDYLMNILNTNLTAAFVCSREALKRMPGNGSVIINLGSINSFRPFAPRHAYGASKAGLEMLSRCQAAELAEQGVRVVTLAPGYIHTAGTAELEAGGRIDANLIRRRIPLGRFGQPQDIADAALFLASGEASYINGSTLYVDGGWTAFSNAGDAAILSHEEHSA